MTLANRGCGKIALDISPSRLITIQLRGEKHEAYCSLNQQAIAPGHECSSAGCQS